MPTIDEYLEQARTHLERVEPEDLAGEVSSGALVIDIRPSENRHEEGAMPGAMVIDRNVLLWRLSPSSDARTVEVETGQRVILFCNDGYASSVAASELKEVGVDGATDLIGGFREWVRRTSLGLFDTVSDESEEKK